MLHSCLQSGFFSFGHRKRGLVKGDFHRILGHGNFAGSGQTIAFYFQIRFSHSLTGDRQFVTISFHAGHGTVGQGYGKVTDIFLGNGKGGALPCLHRCTCGTEGKFFGFFRFLGIFIPSYGLGRRSPCSPAGQKQTSGSLKHIAGTHGFRQSCRIRDVAFLYLGIGGITFLFGGFHPFHRIGKLGLHHSLFLLGILDSHIDFRLGFYLIGDIHLFILDGVFYRYAFAGG